MVSRDSLAVLDMVFVVEVRVTAALGGTRRCPSGFEILSQSDVSLTSELAKERCVCDVDGRERVTPVLPDRKLSLFHKRMPQPSDMGRGRAVAFPSSSAGFWDVPRG